MFRLISLASILMALTSFTTTSFAAAPGEDPIRFPGGAPSASFKVPSRLRANMPIPKAVKTLLDRDFRSRYPVAAPIKVDVVDAWVDLYSAGAIPDGFGGSDTRHFFRVVARHATGALVVIEVAIYERSVAGPDEDRLLIESFRVVGWQP